MARYDRAGELLVDNNDNPLIKGLMDFYKSGSTDDADRISTFADPDQKILNTNPVVLSAIGKVPPIFYDGQANIVIRTSAGVQVEAKGTFPSLAASGTAFAGWDALVTYESDQIVIGSDNRYYLSIISVNLNNDPTSTSGKWQEIRFNDVYDAAETYGIGRIAIATDLNLYISRVNANLNNEPSASPTQWKILTSATSVSGPGSSTDNAIVRWDGTAGNLTQDSGVLIDDTDNMTGVVNITATGLVKAVTGLFGASLPATPDGTFHIHSGSAGAVTAGSGANELVLESAGDCGATLFSPDANFTQFQFGSIGDTIAAVIRWKFTLDQFEFGTSRAGSDVVFSTGVLTEALRLDGTTQGATFASTVILDTTLTLATGSITDSSGAITFVNENLSTTGTLASGALTVTGAIQGSTTLGVGLTRTEGTLHVHTATAGVVTAPTNADDLVIENSVDGGATILIPDNRSGSWTIGSPALNAGLKLLWNHDANIARLASLKVGAVMTFRADNDVTNLTMAGAAGSETAVFAGILTAMDGFTITLGQANLNRGTSDAAFIDFIATADADVTSAISTFTTFGAVQGFVQTDINGTKRWIPFYADPSA